MRAVTFIFPSRRMSSSPIYKLSVPLPTPRRREVFFVPGRSEPLTAAIFGTAGRTLHNIRTPWCSSVSPPRRRTAPGKTLYKNCTSPLFSGPFPHINRNLTQKLQPPPLLCRFAPLIPYTKTARFPHISVCFSKKRVFCPQSPKIAPLPCHSAPQRLLLAPTDPSKPDSLHKNTSLRPLRPLV